MHCFSGSYRKRCSARRKSNSTEEDVGKDIGKEIPTQESQRNPQDETEESFNADHCAPRTEGIQSEVENVWRTHERIFQEDGKWQNTWWMYYNKYTFKRPSKQNYKLLIYQQKNYRKKWFTIWFCGKKWWLNHFVQY